MKQATKSPPRREAKGCPQAGHNPVGKANPEVQGKEPAEPQVVIEVESAAGFGGGRRLSDRITGPQVECPLERGDDEVAALLDQGGIAELHEDRRTARLPEDRETHAHDGAELPTRGGRHLVHDELGQVATTDRGEAFHLEVAGFDRGGRRQGESQVHVRAERVGGRGLRGPVALEQQHTRAGILQRRRQTDDDRLQRCIGADGDAQRRQGTQRSSESITFPYSGDGRPSGPPFEAPQRLHGVRAADLIGDEACVALELTHSGTRRRTEDAIDPTGVEAQGSEAELQLGDVVASHHRGPETHESVAEAELRFHQSRPGRSVADPIAGESRLDLEVGDGRFGGSTELAGGVGDVLSGGAKTPLEIGDGRTAGSDAEGQGRQSDVYPWMYGRRSSSS